MATLIILINLILASLFSGQKVGVEFHGGSKVSISGTVDGKYKTIIIQKTNPIILEGEY
jgi:hypothetical protein